MVLNKYVVTSLLMFFTVLHAKVLIITHNFSSPIFVEIQKNMFEYFLEDEYEYVVFNDANNDAMEKQITEVCEKNSVRCIRVPQEIHTRPYLPRFPGDPLQRPNIRHANCVQYSFDILGFDHDGIVMVVDADMVLIRPFNMAEYMADKDIAGVIKGAGGKNGEVRYICPALCIFSMDRLPDKRTLNFNCGFVDGASVDSGGWSHYYLTSYPELRIVQEGWHASQQFYLGCHDIHVPVDHSVSHAVRLKKWIELGFNEKEIKFLSKEPDTFEFFLQNKFIHYHGVTNYSHQSAQYGERKLRLFKEFFYDITH